MNIKNNQKGNIIVIAVIVSSVLIAVGMSVLSSSTQSNISSLYLESSATAHYDAEGSLESALYAFAGHELGFESSFDPTQSTYATQYDADCNILTNDAWCLETRINNLQDVIPENGFLLLGMYNDISDPYGSSSLLNINPHPSAAGSTDFSMELFTESGTPENDNKVSSGDRRVTNVTVGLNEYNQNSKVLDGDSDINSTLTNLNTYNNEYLITGSDQIWNTEEYVYHDINNDSIVSINDVRISQYKNFSPNTLVGAGDGDLGQELHLPQNLGIIYGSNPSEIYATTIGTITINANVIDGVTSILESWTYTFSKNDFDGSTFVSPFTISWDTKENTHLGLSDQRTFQEFFEDAGNWSVNIWSYAAGLFIQEPILKVTSLHADIAYTMQSPEDSSVTDEAQLTELFTTLTATTKEGTTKQTFQINLSNSQIIPLFGSADIVH